MIASHHKIMSFVCDPKEQEFLEKWASAMNIKPEQLIRKIIADYMNKFEAMKNERR